MLVLLLLGGGRIGSRGGRCRIGGLGDGLGGRFGLPLRLGLGPLGSSFGLAGLSSSLALLLGLLLGLFGLGLLLGLALLVVAGLALGEALGLGRSIPSLLGLDGGCGRGAGGGSGGAALLDRKSVV